MFAAARGGRYLQLGWLLALVTGLAAAQTPTPLQPTADPAARITQLRYESALGDYRPYADAPLRSWPEANAQVQQIGGWRAYAKEGQADEPANDRPAADPHSGHHGGAKP